jgi:hypothetical protein
MALFKKGRDSSAPMRRLLVYRCVDVCRSCMRKRQVIAVVPFADVLTNCMPPACRRDATCGCKAYRYRKNAEKRRVRFVRRNKKMLAYGLIK